MNYFKEVTAKLWAQGRLLLFIGRDKEADHADDNKCVLKQFTVCNHWAPPLSKDQGARSAPRQEGFTAYRYWQR